MKTEKQIAAAAAKFAERWKGRGYEKGESQSFWLDLLSNVYGVETPSDGFINFEDHRMVDASNFIDGRIPSTRVLIEQKSLGRDLRKGIRQSDGSLLNPFQQARRYVVSLPVSEHPRWIVTCNFSEFLVYDMERPNCDPEQILLENLSREYYRLMFLVDSKNEHLSKEMQVSMQAGEIVGRIYDALLKQYEGSGNAGVSPANEVKEQDKVLTFRWLNILCVRIVFCLYAEDAGIFGHDQFHDYLMKFDAEGMRMALLQLFDTLNTPVEKRSHFLRDDLKAFPYTNGGLFEEKIEIPQFTEVLKQVLLQNASLDFDWSEISPTIFGAVFESTLNPETRRSGGMHYTSIENIHKVIDPLFLNDLRKELDEILEEKIEKKRQKKLVAYQDRLASLTFLDPACGSGNFLTETYLSLRRLENEVIRERYHGQKMIGAFINPVKVSIQQFYGIEINDFAVTVATTALWISEAQMLAETEKIIQQDIDFLPLKSYSNICEGNALRIEWDSLLGARASRPQTTCDASASRPQSDEPYFHSRGYLPHIENKEFQSITFRLYDSVPNDIIDHWKRELKWEESRENSDSRTTKENRLQLQKFIDQYEDMGHGQCFLSDPRVAKIVVDALKYNDGKTYRLHNWCVMPNHVHVLIEVIEGYLLTDIVHAWKSYTSHEANKVLCRTGDFWMPEYYDRFIRDDAHYYKIADYIDNNPVKSGLVSSPSDWRWSSAGEGETPLDSASDIDAGEDARAPRKTFDYIMGNPPFVGYSLQSKEQKEDILKVFVDKQGKPFKTAGKIDYVAGWYYKAAKLIAGTNTRAALVSTNSITQGEQVAAIWKPLKEMFGIHIDFAHRTFRWDSEATLKAHVHCVIVGFSCVDVPKVIYEGEKAKKAENINAYLIDAPDIYVESRRQPLCEVPEMVTGNRPADGGHLIIEAEDYADFVSKEPLAKPYIKQLLGASEFINNKERWCLWLVGASPTELRKMPLVMSRVQACKEDRENAPDEGRRKLAMTPHLFREQLNPENSIVIPVVSSERRRYIPMAYINKDIICTDRVKFLPDASLYHFGVLNSNVHMAWMRAVCGRLKSDYNYSKDIVYNNFPWPNLGARASSPANKSDAASIVKKIEQTAQAILDARALYPGSSLADLYDELTMPVELRKAHQANDRAVMQAYGFDVKTMTESMCVAELFKLYQEMTKKVAKS
ncbi:MAG: transposase [Prevotella sp.]|nr:transposase [Prevotella sp.]